MPSQLSGPNRPFRGFREIRRLAPPYTPIERIKEEGVWYGPQSRFLPGGETDYSYHEAGRKVLAAAGGGRRTPPTRPRPP